MDREICVSKMKKEDDKLIRENFSRTFSLYNDYVLHEEFEEKMDTILNMNINNDDIWICSFPKAGTTWTQEMVWCIANDLNFTQAVIPLPQRYIFLDACFLVSPNRMKGDSSVQNKLMEMVSETEEAKQKRARRFIKTHLPYELLPRKLRDGFTKAKIVYVTRNPRDTCISSFHHRKYLGSYKGDLEQYCNMFIKGLVSFGPYWKHLYSYWNSRHNLNLLFIKFEDMKQDLPSVIRKTATHLEKSINENDMDALCEHLSFNSMKNNSSVKDSWTEMVKNMVNPNGNGSFFRKGEVDQWKEDMKPETAKRFEEWEIENLREVNVENYSSL